jgi:hypothetical protein
LLHEAAYLLSKSDAKDKASVLLAKLDTLQTDEYDFSAGSESVVRPNDLSAEDIQAIRKQGQENLLKAFALPPGSSAIVANGRVCAICWTRNCVLILIMKSRLSAPFRRNMFLKPPI